MSARCYVCGAQETLVEAAPHNFLCGECLPVARHVVSMQTGTGGSSVAVCPCGWRSEVNGKGRYKIQQVKVLLHWNDVINRAAYEAGNEEIAA
ncbi:MAG: hypothetical protein AB7L36_00685 [Sphingomonadaceae bacterium]